MLCTGQMAACHITCRSTSNIGIWKQTKRPYHTVMPWHYNICKNPVWMESISRTGHRGEWPLTMNPVHVKLVNQKMCIQIPRRKTADKYWKPKANWKTMNPMNLDCAISVLYIWSLDGTLCSKEYPWCSGEYFLSKSCVHYFGLCL